MASKVIDVIRVNGTDVPIYNISRSPAFYRRSYLPSVGQTSITIHPTWINIGDEGYTTTEDITIDINTSSNWDDSTYATASKRAGKDFYIYMAQPTTTGSSVKIILSANSTVPTGYTAINSRKIGGFHCLCSSVGTISGHTLSGYVTGDIIPGSIWDLRHRPIANPEGMVWIPEIGKWVDIYLASYNNGQMSSVFGGTIVDGSSSPAISGERAAELMGLANKKLLSRDEFIVAAKGSNEGTNINGSFDPGTTGGHTDTAGRRMISNYGLEDCCGVLYQWGRDTYENFPGSTHTGSNLYLDGYSWNEVSVYNSSIDSQKYGSCFGFLRRVQLGASWDGCSNAGSRSANCSNFSSDSASHNASRGCSDSKTIEL